MQTCPLEWAETRCPPSTPTHTHSLLFFSQHNWKLQLISSECLTLFLYLHSIWSSVCCSGPSSSLFIMESLWGWSGGCSGTGPPDRSSFLQLDTQPPSPHLLTFFPPPHHLFSCEENVRRGWKEWAVGVSPGGEEGPETISSGMDPSGCEEGPFSFCSCFFNATCSSSACLCRKPVMSWCRLVIGR